MCLANPNNPTGLMIKPGKIKKLLENIPKTTLLVLDEAYYEYANPEINSISWLEEHPNLVITRTFSKAYGLAGVRLGYAIANEAIISILHKLQMPFAVNQVALVAGLAALNDAVFLKKTLELNRQGMEQMRSGLEALHLKSFPSDANFVTFDCEKDGLSVYQQLLEKGIIVRPLHAYGMPNHLRVTIGTAEQNTRFLKALRSS
jgi:histidinol-phosphate aminotransferase